MIVWQLRFGDLEIDGRVASFCLSRMDRFVISFNDISQRIYTTRDDDVIIRREQS